MTPGTVTPTLCPPGLIWAFALNTLWINASEVFRYFVFVMPMMRDALPGIDQVAPMSVPVFFIWGVWDMLLVVVATGAAWLMIDKLGPLWRSILVTGTAIWASIFVIFWIAVWNMNLATPAILATALPLAWIEMIVATAIVARCCFN